MWGPLDPLSRLESSLRQSPLCVHMKKLIFSLTAALTLASLGHAQQFPLDRLPAEDFEVLPPSARVVGPPGDMRIAQSACQARPTADMRRRIVDIAAQEWGFFGFTVVDQTNIVESESRDRRTRRRGPRLSPQESARVADSIAGYWSITSDGGWILARQNAIWNGSAGVAARWRDPWSAAFVSWVMCEGGLGELSQFRRAIAHHAYIDQAIEARDEDVPQAAFVAYDVGELPIEPGDLLCSARRSAYRSIADRRENLGDGIRSHCDIVMKLDETNDRILAIGGNVRGAVRLKLLPAVFAPSEGLAPAVRSVGRGRRAVFAHLKLRAASIEANAFDNTPTIKTLSERGDALGPLRQRLEAHSVTSCCQAQNISTSGVATRASGGSTQPL